MKGIRRAPSTPTDRVVFGAGAALAAVSVAGWMGGVWWGFDAFSHFRVQYVQLCLPFIGLALWRRKNRQAIFFATLAALNYAVVLPFYLGRPAPAAGPSVRAMLVNLNVENRRTERVTSAVRRADPDLLLFEEATPAWAERLAPLIAAYPYRVEALRDDPFGILLLSRFPLKNGRVERFGSTGLPVVAAEVRTPFGDFAFYGVHAPPPLNARYVRRGRAQLAALAEAIRTQRLPAVTMGDLNASPWSRCFVRFRRASGLVDSEKGFGFQPTWPVRPGFFRIPLDHLLHSPSIEIRQRGTGTETGSDHLPLCVDFVLP